MESQTHMHPESPTMSDRDPSKKAVFAVFCPKLTLVHFARSLACAASRFRLHASQISASSGKKAKAALGQAFQFQATRHQKQAS